MGKDVQETPKSEEQGVDGEKLGWRRHGLRLSAGGGASPRPKAASNSKTALATPRCVCRHRLLLSAP